MFRFLRKRNRRGNRHRRGGARRGESANAPSSNVIQLIVNEFGVRGIPVLPATAMRAFLLSVDPKAGVREFRELIESDEALSAKIVRIANSVFFERSYKAKTVEESINVIGINEVKAILNANSLRKMFVSKQPNREILWQHDILTGVISRLLAEKRNPDLGSKAFLAGLLHDIGKLLLLERSPERYAKVFSAVRMQGKSFMTAEEEVFCFNHADVGALACEKWKLPDEVRSAVFLHHCEITGSIRDTRTLITMCVKVSDHIANALDICPQYASNTSIRKQHADLAKEGLKKLGIKEDLNALLSEITESYEREKQILT